MLFEGGYFLVVGYYLYIIKYKSKLEMFFEFEIEKKWEDIIELVKILFVDGIFFFGKWKIF